eukprot:CAMPEP_0183307946 /NCGR_PEP_ID=MMETSP0160_2-20130417/19649_1 /TAXON_ID=2839 ORGANISM="Odontella Sinensis, Strain Grunow 1884" /NCGR_SAMPLE_ID=MMETSP0160_2 /ASSEMBLY_ACC=CAM_ASM_000250 /LENGTH=298 /DNA_ID=CAMNT_0025471669 /DNA_START=81 /DNA_END=977 /DNA_ORIENTATION=+
MSSDTPFLPSIPGADSTVKVRFGSSAPSESTPPRFALGYWSIRGLGAPLRMMLSAAKVDHDVVLHDLVEGDDGKGWVSEYFSSTKPELAKEFPLMNLPYVADRTQRRILSQTNSCLTHTARAVGMWPSDPIDASRCEALLCEIMDLRNQMVKFAYGGDGSKETAEKCVGASMKSLSKLEAWLKIEEKNGDGDAVHLVGGKFSAPDFHLFEMLDQYEGLCSFNELGDLYKDFPHLKKFKTGFEKLDENKFFLHSWLHTELPFNNCVACFGSLPGPELYTRGESAKSATWRKKGDVTLSP